MWYIPNDNTRSAQYFDKNWYVVTERMLEKLQGEFPIDKALLE